MNELLNTILRSIFAYFFLMIVIRTLGRKTISQMTFFDFAFAITLGTLAANVATGANADSLTATIVVLTFASLSFVLGYSHIKSFSLRKLINSEPITLIQNGEIVKDNMQKSRVTLNDLTTMLRKKNVFNIADVEFALLENDGILSVQPKSQKQPLTPSDMNIPTSYKGLTKDIIIDGNIMQENLKDANLDEHWLMNQLKEKGITHVKDVFFAALDTSGSLYVSKGIVGQEKPGEYGLE